MGGPSYEGCKREQYHGYTLLSKSSCHYCLTILFVYAMTNRRSWVSSTMGSVYRIPFFYVEDVVSLKQKLQGRGIRFFAAHLQGKNSYEDDFNMLDESIRGAVPEGSGLFKQITLTLNPWNEHHWIKKRFFDTPDDEVLAMTTNYKCNEWLDKADLKVFETMKKQNPRRYKVAGLGDWGIVDGLVYENWEEKAFSVDEVKKISGVKSVFGLDFGYTNDPSALFCGFIDQSSKTIWVFDEMYQPGMSNEAIAEQVQRMGYVKEKITADSAEPKSIDRLRELGLKGIRKARKGKDSINNGIDFIQDYHIIIHPRCVNFITEISNYQWDKDTKTGKKLNRPINDFNHLMDAMRYAVESIVKGDAFSFD